MCTAVNFGKYFGRNLDNERSFGENIAVTSRNFKIELRSGKSISSHKAMMGMAHIRNGIPLYYDCINEAGLYMAGLNFYEAAYRPPSDKLENIASFELIPYILSYCSTVDDAIIMLKKINLTNVCFEPELPPSPLHWMIADKKRSIAVESTIDRINIYKNPAGVLTNSPNLPTQLFSLNSFIKLSPKTPKNNFGIPLKKYSRGMGTIGLPGDLSSNSRFVRAAFVRANSKYSDKSSDNISQFFHILNSVEQPFGCCELESGEYEYTIYQSCIDSDSSTYYYRTYYDQRIRSVSLKTESLNMDRIISFELENGEEISI